MEKKDSSIIPNVNCNNDLPMPYILILFFFMIFPTNTVPGLVGCCKYLQVLLVGEDTVKVVVGMVNGKIVVGG